jgi:hypothetical protein
MKPTKTKPQRKKKNIVTIQHLKTFIETDNLWYDLHFLSKQPINTFIKDNKEAITKDFLKYLDNL